MLHLFAHLNIRNTCKSVSTVTWKAYKNPVILELPIMRVIIFIFQLVLSIDFSPKCEHCLWMTFWLLFLALLFEFLRNGSFLHVKGSLSQKQWAAVTKYFLLMRLPVHLKNSDLHTLFMWHLKSYADMLGQDKITEIINVEKISEQQVSMCVIHVIHPIVRRLHEYHPSSFIGIIPIHYSILWL